MRGENLTEDNIMMQSTPVICSRLGYRSGLYGVERLGKLIAHNQGPL